MPEDDRKINIFDGDKLIGSAKYFYGIEKPLFSFYDSPMKSCVKTEKDGSKKLELQLYLECGLPNIFISDDDLPDSLYEFITRIFDNRCTNHGEVYKLREEARIVLDADDGWPGRSKKFIDMTFYEPSKAQAFVDYINNNYKFD